MLFQTARDIEAGKYTDDDVDWLVSTTTWNSDANAARELYGFVGGGDVTVGIVLVNSLIHDVLDLDDIILDHPPGFDDSIALDPNNWVSANSVNRAAARLLARRGRGRRGPRVPPRPPRRSRSPA